MKTKVIGSICLITGMNCVHEQSFITDDASAEVSHHYHYHLLLKARCALLRRVHLNKIAKKVQDLKCIRNHTF